MSDIYSQLKPAWHEDRLNDLRTGRRPVPVHVQLVLSDLCNQDCVFCAYRMSSGLSSELFALGELAKIGTNNPKRQIPTDKALEIVEDCATLGVKAIQFTGGGEPTAHPQHLDIIHRAQALGMDTALVTNGLRLDPLSPAIHGLKWIRVSVDAGDPEMYAQTRRVPPAHWATVWKNVGTLAERYEGVLGIGFVVTPENYRGIEQCARIAKDHGARNLRVGAVFSTAGVGYYGDHIPAIVQTIRDAKASVDGDGFEILDLFGRRLGDLESGSPTESLCSYQYLTVFIGGDLNVYRCCNTAYTTAGKVGSLARQRLRYIRLDYEPFDARKCQFCQFLGQNRAIAALMKPPTHVNFV